MTTLATAISLSARFANQGFQALAVGGFVRDRILDVESKDIDIEVYGCSFEQATGLLTSFGYEVDLVGKAFGVIKIKHPDIDVSLPRRDNKAGVGHKGFEVIPDPNMSIREAASRRDYTINSMAMNLSSGEIIDPFGGINDLKNRVLRHTSDAFDEDPLRVLRGMQFIGRFGLAAAPETLEKCSRLNLAELPPERIFEEFKKLLLKGRFVGAALQFMKESRAIRFFPELFEMSGCVQDVEHHPEGDVLSHTGHVSDFLARNRTGEEEDDLILGFAGLCHDMGKPVTTAVRNGRITAYGHDTAGEEPTRSFMARMTNQRGLVDSVCNLVVTHMRPGALFHDRAPFPSDGAIRRLAAAVDGRLDLLARLVEADRGGRPPLPPDDSVSRLLLESGDRLGIRRGVTAPIVQGRHLIELGLTPSPKFGKILRRAYEAQLDNVFTDLDGGLEFVKQYSARRDTERTS